MSFHDLTGQKFGRLTVVNRAGTGKDKQVLWLCKCDCGSNCIVFASNLRKGHTKSCGCLQKEATSKANKTHGMRHSRLYHIWNAMIGRCHRKADRAYPSYGGRGIAVCDEWHSFAGFHSWALAAGYEDGLSIDRIDNDLGYSPSNCRWVTRYVQANNKRSNRCVEYNGETHTIAEWAEILGIKYATLRKRINDGWDVEKAFSAPVRGGGSNDNQSR